VSLTLPVHSHIGYRGAARLSFTARIEGAHSDRAASASKKDDLAAPRTLGPARMNARPQPPIGSNSASVMRRRRRLSRA